MAIAISFTISIAKLLNLIPHFITYSALLKAAVEKIKSNINLYTSFFTESVESALEDLDSYLKDKQYSLNSNIIDVVISNGNIVSNKRIIEMAFINGHYDLVIKKFVKQELVSPTTDTSAVQISQSYLYQMKPFVHLTIL